MISAHTMFSPELRELLSQVNRQLRIIWLGMVVSVPVYVVVTYLLLLNHTGGQGAELDGTPLVWPLAGAALVLGIVAIIYRQTKLSEEAVQSGLNKPLPTESPHAAKAGALSAPEQRLFAAVIHMQTPWVVSLGLSESVVIVGFVLAGFLEHRLDLIIPFAVASLALHLLILPKPQAMAEKLWQRAQQGAA